VKCLLAARGRVSAQLESTQVALEVLGSLLEPLHLLWQQRHHAQPAHHLWVRVALVNKRDGRLEHRAMQPLQMLHCLVKHGRPRLQRRELRLGLRPRPLACRE
jgi:hypothetical protein